MTVVDVTSIINSLLPEPHAGLLAGILFGVKAALAPALYEDLVRTGTLHIVALSGMNITILMTLTNVVLLRIVGRRVSSVLTIILIVWFVVFVGLSASVIRAAIMGSITLFAVILGRQYWALWSWIIAAALMLALNPAWIGDISFQLSVMATLGIILFGKKSAVRSKPEVQEEKAKPLFARLVSWLEGVVGDDFRITLAAQVFTIPLIFFSFHRISLISPLSNVLIGFIVAPLTAAGLLMVTIGLLFLPLAQVIAWVVWVPLAYILLVVRVLSRVPFASLGW
jgi:competence protein ComEC